ncbi:1030_t:CDS:1, partial [Gigaspora rosea]
MQIHASIVIMITAKNNTSLFTYGIAQYQSSENTFVSLCWKLFDSSNKSFDFSVRDIVTLARKFVIENSEQYITVASVTKVDKKDSSDKFYAELIFLNTLHLMFNATVTRDLNTI